MARIIFQILLTANLSVLSFMHGSSDQRYPLAIKMLVIVAHTHALSMQSFAVDMEQKALDPVVRFWRMVDKSDGHGPNGNCWIWLGHLNAQGYGHFRESSWRNGGKLALAHRYSCLIHFGDIGSDKVLVCHKCDYPRCVNPEHLFLGTKKDNTDDRIAKGRSTRNKVLIDEQNARKVVELHRGGMTQVAIAEQFGCHKQVIWNIVSGRYKYSAKF